MVRLKKRGGGEKRCQQLPALRETKGTNALTATREARRTIAETDFIFVSGWEDVVEGKGRCEENDDSGSPEEEDTSTPQRLFATSYLPSTFHPPVRVSGFSRAAEDVGRFRESAERRIIKDTVVR